MTTDKLLETARYRPWPGIKPGSSKGESKALESGIVTTRQLWILESSSSKNFLLCSPYTQHVFTNEGFRNQNYYMSKKQQNI